MTTTYRGSRRDQRIADEYLDGQMACSFCGVQTPKDDLANFGARCRGCFEAYCSGGRVYQRLTPADRRAMGDKVRAAIAGRLRLSGREHIAMLQARADAGESMSPGQRGFLQAVRRAAGLPDEPRAAVPAQPDAPAVDLAPAHAHQAEGPDDLPPWVFDDLPLADAARFPDPNHAEAAC